MIPMKTLTMAGKTYEIVDEWARQSIGSPSDEQVAEAVKTYLDNNPVSSATATVENGVLKVT